MINTFLRYREFVKKSFLSGLQKVKFAFFWIFFNRQKIASVNHFELKVYSQGGEDGISKIIFHKIGATNKYFVELGAGNGKECNTRLLLEKGWTGLQIDSKKRKSPFIKRAFITAENIEAILKKYKVPKNFDLLSIDIDGNDYWVWKAIESFIPRVVIIEYNATIPLNKSKVIPYKADFKWDKTNYFGASLKALTRLANQKGYLLVGCDSAGTNAFFVLKKLVKRHFKTLPFTKLFKPPKYGIKINGHHIGHGTPYKSKPFMAV